MNMLQLNYNNYLDFADNIQPISKEGIKLAADAKHLGGVISDDMKMYALDILTKTFHLNLIQTGTVSFKM